MPPTQQVSDDLLSLTPRSAGPSLSPLSSHHPSLPASGGGLGRGREEVSRRRNVLLAVGLQSDALPYLVSGHRVRDTRINWGGRVANAGQVASDRIFCDQVIGSATRGLVPTQEHVGAHRGRDDFDRS